MLNLNFRLKNHVNLRFKQNNMPYQKRISDINGFVNSVAALYTDPLRVLMEYIDNSIDSADDLRKKSGGIEYPRNINISVKIINEKKFGDCRIVITDNCAGMNSVELKGIVEEIGNSRKKASSWLNGQFGFGVHAYASFCEQVTFLTRKESSESALQIEIDKSSPFVNNEKEVDPKVLPANTGTMVILSNFKDRHSWKQIEAIKLKKMIEEHFEFKLLEKKININVIEGGNEYSCEPFNYETVDGTTFERTIDYIEREDKRSLLRKRQKLTPPVKIYLRVAKVPQNRRVLFFSKGRRICEATEEKAFMNISNKKTSLWGHPNLIGYIDVTEALQPQLNRNGFTNTWQAKALYEEITDFENEISDELEKINEATRNESLENLGNLISSILSDIAKADNLKFRSEGFGNQSGTAEGSLLGGLEEGRGGFGKEKNDGVGGFCGGTGMSEDEGINPEIMGDFNSDVPGGDGKLIPLEDGNDETKKKPAAGINIEFLDTVPPAREDGELIRSDFAGLIYIYSQHPEFIRRKTENKGKIKLNSELISYIGGEVATHYRDEWYNKKKLQLVESDRKRVMQDMVDFIIEFENRMKPYINKSADEIGF